LLAVNPRAFVAMVFVYLAFVGHLRRALIPFAGWPQTDALLLLGSACGVLLFGYVLLRGFVRLDTNLAKWIAAFLGIMVVQIFNPRQGGLMVGVAGALFYIVPMLWFWCGRAMATPNFVMKLFHWCVVPIGVIAAGHGIFQAFVGYLPYEKTWIALYGYSALYVTADAIRTFSIFPSTAEYAAYLCMTVAVIVAGVFNRRILWAVILPVILLALFVLGSRGPMVVVTMLPALLWAAQGRSRTVWLPRLALAVFVFVSGLLWTLSQAKNIQWSERVQPLVSHQVEGLHNANESTAPAHFTMIGEGLLKGFSDPLGSGLGATTMRGSAGSTETDWANMFVSVGAIGGLLYTIIIIKVIALAARFWGATRTPVALVIAAVLASQLLQWLNGAHYSVAPIVWFTIGALDRFARPGTRQVVAHAKAKSLPPTVGLPAPVR